MDDGANSVLKRLANLSMSAMQLRAGYVTEAAVVTLANSRDYSLTSDLPIKSAAANTTMRYSFIVT